MAESDEVLEAECGHHGLQGSRKTMEDETFICQRFELGGDKDGQLPGYLSFYAVFDGHGGNAASEYCRDHLFRNVVCELRKGGDTKAALKVAFAKTDDEFITSVEEKESSGSTAVVCLLHHSSRRLWVANVGDSRCIGDDGELVVALSNDHKPTRPDEVERIKGMGGFIIHNRVMGDLAVSRAFGDQGFKDPQMKLVIAEPEIEERVLTRADNTFLLLACDGLYDVMKNGDAAYYVKRLLRRSKHPKEICQQMAEHAVTNLQTRDNVSVVVVRLWAEATTHVCSHKTLEEIFSSGGGDAEAVEEVGEAASSSSPASSSQELVTTTPATS